MQLKSFFLPAVFLFLLFCGCITKKKSNQTNDVVRFSGYIHAENLSEDGTAFSTKNDEIVFLNYFIPADTANQPVTLNAAYYVFDSLQKTEKFSSTRNEFYAHGNICIMLIEIDGDRNAHYYDSVCRMKIPQIEKAITVNNQLYLSKIFDDDDLLGIQKTELDKMPYDKEIVLTFEGHQLFEKYRYTVDIKRSAPAAGYR